MGKATRHLEAIRAAGDGVSFGPVGYAAVVAPPDRAYQALLDDRDTLARCRPALEALAATEGPSGPRVYAALLLRELDRGAGLRALEAMLGSERPCSFAGGGCMVESLWLGEVAARLLGDPVPPPPKRLAMQALDRLGMLGDRVAPPDDEAPSPWTSEYQTLVRDHAAMLPVLAERLARLTHHPEKPAPRYYAALLLARAGDRARLRELALDPMPVHEETAGGARYVTLGAALRRFLTDEERAGLPPPPEPGQPPALEEWQRPMSFFDRVIARFFGA